MTLSLLTPYAWAQQVPPVTGAEGVVVDVRTGEPIAFAQVVFVGTQIGTMVDAEGHFQVENKQGLVTLSVGFVGYKKRIVTLHANRMTRGMRIELEPDVRETDVCAGQPREFRIHGPSLHHRRQAPAETLFHQRATTNQHELRQ